MGEEEAKCAAAEEELCAHRLRQSNRRLRGRTPLTLIPTGSLCSARGREAVAIPARNGNTGTRHG